MPDDPTPSPNPDHVQDDRLRSVWRRDPGALGGPPSRPLRITSPALEHAVVQLGHLSAPFGRTLYVTEKRFLRTIFRDSLDLDRIRVVETRVANAPTTLGNQIRIAPGRSLATDEGKSILVHECTHVWQYQTQGTRYITCSIAHQVAAATSTGTRNAAYFNYQLSERSRFADFPAEEQAQIVQDYYDMQYRYAGPRAAAPPSWVRQRQGSMRHYIRMIRELRAARPRRQEQIYSDALMQAPRQDLVPPPADPSRRFVPIMPFLRVDF